MTRIPLPAVAALAAAAVFCLTAPLAIALPLSPLPGFSGVVRIDSPATPKRPPWSRPGIVDRDPPYVIGGEADRARRIPIGAATRFRLASLTKTVTAVLVLKAVDEHRLDLDAPLGDRLPGVTPQVRRVTPRQLLQHTSGLANPNDGTPDDRVPPFYARVGAGAGDHQAAARGVCSGPAKAEPGAGFSYNNCDYLVLGALLEQIYKKPFDRLVDERITQPLHLTWRMAPGTRDARDPVALGYDDKGAPELFQNSVTYGAAGGLIGTVDDVLTFDRALMAGRLLSPARLKDLTTADPKLYGEALSVWSYDLDVGCGRKARVWERQGDIGGTRLVNLMVPAEKTVVVIASNTARDDLFDTYSRKGLGYTYLRVALGVSCSGAASPP